jgi:2-methylisocitrate lyase-like PEP mutase family enzyme
MNLQEKAAALRKLHQGPRLLVLPNCWDAASARLIARAGAQAMATSSAGIAYALGYPDGQLISRAEMLDMVRRVAAAVQVPVTADVEAGYGDAAETARQVIAAGAVGMNLEDAAEDGTLFSLQSQIERIRAARAAADAKGVALVINGRTDAFAAPGLADEVRLSEAVKRANAYLEAGADCAFVPFISAADVIAQLARQIRGPLNILASPATPSLAELERMGVRRASLGSAVARAAYGRAQLVAQELLGTGSFKSLDGAIPYSEMQSILTGK